MTEGQSRAQIGRLILFTTLWLTLFLLSVKVSAGWATRSLSLMAESLYTLLTGFSTLLSLLTITPSERPKRRSVNGHSKRESVITLLFIAFLGFAGLNLLVSNCSPQLRCGIANDVSDSYALQIDGIPEKIATSKKEFVENWLMQFLSTKS